MRVYIAGPMSGIEGFNYPAFNKAAAELRALGYVVENPAENEVPPCGSWAGYMRNAIRQMLTCDVVAMLPGWETSKGANIELRLACDLGLQVSLIADLAGGEKRGTGSKKSQSDLFADYLSRNIPQSSQNTASPSVHPCGNEQNEEAA